jgi:hypothetical protein
VNAGSVASRAQPLAIEHVAVGKRPNNESVAPVLQHDLDLAGHIRRAPRSDVRDFHSSNPNASRSA